MTKTPIELVEKWRIHSQKLNDALLESTSRAYRTCANELEAALAAQWISVEERLPKNAKVVFVLTGFANIPSTGYFEDKKWLVGDDDYRQFINVTNWMPIPPLP